MWHGVWESICWRKAWSTPGCAYSPEIGAAREARPWGVEYRAEDEAGGLDTKEGGSVKIWSLPTCFDGPLAFLADWVCGFPQNPCWRWGHCINGGKNFGEEDLHDPLAMGPEKGRLQQVRMRLGGWIWRRWKKAKVCRFPACFPGHRSLSEIPMNEKAASHKATYDAVFSYVTPAIGFNFLNIKMNIYIYISTHIYACGI